MGHGAFSKALLEALTGEADVFHDGVITRQMAQGYSKLNQQVSEINQEQSTIERTATARRNDMQALGVQVQG